MRFNLSGFEGRFEAMAHAFGLKGGNGTQLIDALFALNERLGLPTRLRDVGVEEKHLEELSDQAFADFCHPNNPKPVSRADFRRIYGEAF
jgi:alcohol dehydrogenase class IV